MFRFDAISRRLLRSILNNKALWEESNSWQWSMRICANGALGRDVVIVQGGIEGDMDATTGLVKSWTLNSRRHSHSHIFHVTWQVWLVTHRFGILSIVGTGAWATLRIVETD